MKIKSVLSVIVILLVCSACNKQKDLPKVDVCTIENPLETIDWLKTNPPWISDNNGSSRNTNHTV